MTIRILSPEGDTGEAGIEPAPAPETLAGRRLAVLDNGKPGANTLLTRIADQLAARTGVEFVGVLKKRTAATPCAEELVEEIVGKADLVLTGAAD